MSHASTARAQPISSPIRSNPGITDKREGYLTSRCVIMCTCDDQDLCCYFADPNNNTVLDHEQPCSNENEQKLSPEQFESTLITVTPPTLTFPYNNPKNHVQRLTLWNGTINALRIQIRSPDPDVFTIHLDAKSNPTKSRPISQIQLHGLAAKTISIRCNPGRYKIARVPLQLIVSTSRNECECLQLPLEIYPSTAWFNLPKTIIIPEVALGRKAHALIILPQPRVSERFFVTFQPTCTQNAITLSPMHGNIGGDDGIKQLRVTYAPKEYTTVACSISVHFPGLSTETAHEIKILARCRPGNEADMIRKEIEEIESFRPKPARKKKKFPKIRFAIKKKDSQIIGKKGQDETAIQPLQLEPKKTPLSLFTLAGVMRFLLSKVDLDSQYKEDQHDDHDEYRRKTAVEILALNVELDHEEKLKIYNDIKKRLWLEYFDQNKPSYQRPIVRAKLKRDWEEFQKAVGIALMGKMQGLSSPPPEKQSVYSAHRMSRFVRHDSWGSGSAGMHGGASAKQSYKTANSKRKSMKKSVRKSVSEDEKKMYKSIMADVQLDLTPKQKFVQLVLLIITRQRAAKRLKKIKVLVQNMKKVTWKRSSKSSTKTASVKQSNEGSMKRKSGLSQPSSSQSHDTTGKKSSKSATVPTTTEERRSSGQSQKEPKRKSSEGLKAV